jgi:hypothetical protein
LLVTMFAFLGSVVATAAAFITHPMPRTRGLMSLDAGALRVGHRRVIRCTDVEAVVRVGSVVRVVRAGTLAVEVRFATEQSADSLVEALTPPITRPLTLVTRRNALLSSVRAQLVFVSSLLAAIAFGIATHGNPAALLLTLAMLAFLVTPTRVIVRPDGLAIRWLWMRGFVPFTAIASAQAMDARVVVRLHDGRTLLLGTLDLRSDPTRGATAEAVAQRLLAMREVSLGVSVPARTLAAKGLDDVRSWIERLRRARVGSYRQAVVTTEGLWGVVRDANADESARVGAAAALRASLSTAQIEELHELGDACASPRMRVALRAVAEDDDPLGGDDLAWARAFEEP